MRIFDFEGRRKRSCEALAGKGLEATLFFSKEALRYLTGFHGSDSALLLAPRFKELITDPRFSEEAQVECPDIRVLTREEPLVKVIARRLKKKGFQRVGLESKKFDLFTYRQLYREAKGIRFKAADDILEEERLLKEPGEVERIEKAASIAEASFLEVLGALREGSTEAEAANLLEFEMKRRGAEGPAFPTIAAFGRNSSQPHATLSKRKLGAQSLALFDWGAVVDGYRSDLTRIVVAGRIRREVASVYKVVQEALKRAIEAVEPGVPLRKVDEAARRVIEREGFDRNFGHGVGHGVGLEVHEPPVLNSRAKGIIKEGMVFTVEPAVYLPGKFGVRLEQMIQVTGRGARLLTRLPTDFGAFVLTRGRKRRK